MTESSTRTIYQSSRTLPRYSKTFCAENRVVTRRRIEENRFSVKNLFTLLKFRFASLKVKRSFRNSNWLLLPNQHKAFMEFFVSAFAFDRRLPTNKPKNAFTQTFHNWAG